MRPVLLVETNFVVGLVLGRDGTYADSMELLLERAERDEMELVVPAFSLLEASTVLRAIQKDRNRLRDSLLDKERELRRNRHEAGAAGSLATFRTELLQLAQRSGSRFRDLLRRLLDSAIVIPLDGAIISRAFLSDWGSDLADATVLVSCEAHLRGSRRDKAGLLTLNANDFDAPPIRSLLTTLGCRLLTDPRAAIAWLDHPEA